MFKNQGFTGLGNEFKNIGVWTVVLAFSSKSQTFECLSHDPIGKMVVSDALLWSFSFSKFYTLFL